MVPQNHEKMQEKTMQGRLQRTEEGGRGKKGARTSGEGGGEGDDDSEKKTH